MINYNDYDLHRYDDYMKMLEYLGDSDEPTEDEVWEIAKELEQVPVFENLLYELTINKIDRLLLDNHGIELNRFINGRDTHIYIDGDELCDVDDLIKKIEGE